MKNSEFQFSDPIIDNIIFSKNTNFKKEKFNGFETQFKTSINKMEEENRAIVNLNIVIGENNENYPFTLELTISANFKWEDTQESLDKLLKTNAPAMLLSYARPIVNIITNQAGYKPFNIPFINFNESKECDK